LGQKNILSELLPEYQKYSSTIKVIKADLRLVSDIIQQKKQPIRTIQILLQLLGGQKIQLDLWSDR
jgi:hypothetical protein